MDELMQQMADKIGNMVQSAIIEKTKVIDIDQTLPLELNQKQLATLLGCSTSRLPEFIYRKDFPKIDRGYGRRLAFPRDAVREWYNKNWYKL
ncbi:helix-turn-helix transcriptional regulator [Streptococcus pseudoporcinus]|uniref:Helix-turn-helix domain-containing protein n=1 Tax=Streptococcus pseudoporcinus LQ 940-04 TaxID=875093 RepID=G5K866_9STRE|nr:helix-turn-helix domain-containing protein [Streptococcus pseudoporcinus]QBX10475.1 putative DNA-binding phage protein [Streptococcus satellite phage Javan441]QBX10494.1 putative DNA-binding phage protein [Streptococcus satellite phage Javan442]EFR44880.1 hypothetical protein HMPREF9320_0987 [Streptococcus pseudoporcinus SPIN 20026]EHI64626.1 hypothetical protein STRPS_1139 [Streptococcus pseudoporcinus LQ 940-04]VEF94011.1 DNA-binding phage protein [Streptococcus pseudoporcinus]